MSTKETITVIFYDKTEMGDQEHMLPGSKGFQGRVVELKKSILAKSLTTLISDVHDVLAQLPVSSDKSELESISVSVQISAQGGAAVVVSASAEITNTMTLTFRLVKHEQ